MTRGKRPRIPTIGDVRSRFQRWRQTRQGKTPIPDELWAAAGGGGATGWRQSDGGCVASGWR